MDIQFDNDNISTTQSSNLSNEETISISDLEELNLMGDDLDIDNISIEEFVPIEDDEEFEIVDYEHKKEGPKFKGKFYIDFLGINSLVILKEDTDVLSDVIFAFFQPKIKHLITNIEMFNEHINEKSKELVANETLLQMGVEEKIMENIIKDWRYRYAEFLKMVDIYRPEGLDSIELEYTDTQTSISMINSSSFRKTFFNLQRENSRKRYEIYNKIKQIYVRTKEKQLSTEQIKDVREKYRNSSYSYTEKELKVLRALGFPVSIAKTESSIKKMYLTEKTGYSNSNLDLKDNPKLFIFNLTYLMDNGFNLKSIKL